MNIITAVASFQLDGPISFIDIIASKEFKKFKRRGNILFIYFGCTRRKFAILFKSGKVITLITKTDGADQHIRRFSKKVAKRIYRANGGSGRVHDYRLRNCVVKIETHEYDQSVVIKTRNGGKVRFTPSCIIIVRYTSQEAFAEALEEAKERYVEERLHLLNME